MSNELPHPSRMRHIFVTVAGIGYALFLGWIAFWPTPVDRPVGGLLDKAIAEAQDRGVPTFVDYHFVEFFANVSLFVPVGFIVGLMLRPSRWPLALTIGPLVSVGIELIQLFFIPERYGSISDVIANSIGSAMGVAGAILLRWAVATRDAQVIARRDAQWAAGHGASVIERGPR